MKGTRLKFILLAVLAIAPACTDGTADPTAAVPESAPQLSRHGNTDTPRVFYVESRKNGRYKRLKVKYFEAMKSLELETMAETGPVDNCPVEDPTCVECTLDDPNCGRMFVDELASGETTVYVDTGEPAYELTEGAYGPYYCPAYVDEPHFTWRGHHFELENARVTKQSALPTNSGLPKARYLLPNGPWYSDDRKAVIWSGMIDATCFVQDHQVLGIRITEGFMSWYGFRGDAQETSFAGTSGYNFASSDGSKPHIPGDAQQALQDYLVNGECTPGWVIVVDGRRVC